MRLAPAGLTAYACVHLGANDGCTDIFGYSPEAFAPRARSAG